MSFPMTEIGGVAVSRMMIGTNWFLGSSHTSLAKDQWLKRYMTVERVVEVLEACTAEGLNCICSGPDEKIRAALLAHEEKTGRHIYSFLTPVGSCLSELLDNIESCAEWGTEFCLPHQSYTDNNLIVAEKRIADIEEVIEKIRSLRMIPGLSTHRPETITVCDGAGYDVATYIQPYNVAGFLCQVETDWVARIINNTPKPVMVIKPLAAGRLLPPTALSFVYNSIKPIDTVCVGLLSPEEAREDISIARSLLTGIEEKRQLQYTRSKSALESHMHP